ncbi:MAG: 3'-5' exonuclease domain-containing protein 2 [Bacteroidales bacterium]|nr:3'-5' exonuclease domain-containing protein 2 [Bacteroidales bacterium]
MYVKSVDNEDIARLPLAAFEGSITVIDKPGKEFEHAIRYLKTKSIIGFDTESRPCFSANQIHFGVSLLQLSGSEKAFLFRIKTLGMQKQLCRILSDKNIIKVGAAVADDIKGLQHYQHFEPRSFVDLQKIVWEWGIKDKSVKKMSAIILGMRISKSQQLSNWEAENLSESQQKYAATDAWVCREMYKRLMASEKNPLTPEEMAPPVPTEHKTEHNG